MGERVEWSDLPKELLPIIGKSLETRVDVLRFRSVCSSWRSSIPPFRVNSPRFPVKFPHPCSSSLDLGLTYLCQSALYRLQTLNPSTSTSSSSSSNKGWLIKVEESNPGELRLLEPLSNIQIRSFPLNPHTLNLLNCRIVELTKVCALRFLFAAEPGSEDGRKYELSESAIPGVDKVVMFPNSPWTSADECAIFVLFLHGKLAFAKYRDENLTFVDDGSSEFDDIIVYKGQFYVVDRLGIVWWIDCSSLKLVQYSPPLCGLGVHKHLVESCGALYVVDRYLDGERRRLELDNFFSFRAQDCSKTVCFEVYRLDEDWDQWVLEKSLGDKAFVLGTDCSFSVSTQELFGFEGNRIYFIDHQENRVFNLEDHSIEELLELQTPCHLLPIKRLTSGFAFLCSISFGFSRGCQSTNTDHGSASRSKPGTNFAASVVKIPLFHANSPRFPYPPSQLFVIAIRYLCQRLLIKVEESNPGELILLDPLSNRQISSSPYNRKTLNLLNCRIVELTKAWALSYTVEPRSEAGNNHVYTKKAITGVNKVVMFPNSPWTSADECAIFVLFLDGKLAFAKYGDENLTPVDDGSSEFDDIIVYKGQFYVVDRLGIVSWIDCSSLNLVQYSQPLCGSGKQKHLVESGGALYVLDRYLKGERRILLDNNFRVRYHGWTKTVGFRVYRLDEERGQWIREKSLGDKAFGLSDDCSFSVSTRELFGFKGNRIYFLATEGICVFNLEDRSIKESVCSADHFDRFWPFPRLA
ncbi:hypothetical protein CJ030_MR2G004729 [Morella rubra]|uniref:KIB1-4 beta-propeller domain-containing protein n=1 Tax=Morella rubra TaxID=262757 RepID=A0A6A1WFS7_9ROSI|nr:hypothetical protein CJ030_MR2G004729 [Morella rubra]